jgi:Peptidase family M28
MPARKVSSDNSMHRSTVAALLLVLVPGVAFTLAFGVLSAERRASASPPAGGDHLVVEVRGAPRDLAQALTALLPDTGAPPRIRLIGNGWALIEIRAGGLDAIRARVVSARVLRAFVEPPALYQVRESALDRETATALAPHTLLQEASEDLRVFVLEDALPLRPHALAGLERADAHDLPERLSPSALLPLPAAERAHPYRQHRLADPTARARAIALAGEVDPARLEQTVVDLSTGPGATRYSGRPEVNTFARQYLMDALAALFSAPGDTIFEDPFPAHVEGEHGFDAVLHNVIARRRGEVPGSGKYVLGAHYDATASRTEPWGWETEPAPGADDNGSGVACVLEAARVLTQERYDFDLEFAFYGGEEQVLLGSKAYVADSVLSEVDQVIGAIILDMVAYNPRQADSLNVLTNFTSEWLADLLRESEAVLPANHGLDDFDKVVHTTLNYSDHAAYWGVDASAVLLIENTVITTHNPNYHRVTDTIDYLHAVDGPDLMRRTTEVVVAFLGQFARGQTPSAMAFAAPGVLFHNDEEEVVLETTVGRTVTARARVTNFGALETEVRVHGEVATGGHILGAADTSLASWGSGVTREILVPFLVTPDLESGETIDVRIQLSAEPGRAVEVAASGQLEVTPLSVFVAPNPVRGSLATADLWLTLTEPVEVECRVMDVLGSNVGKFAGQVDAGDKLPLSLVVGRDDLPSGVYLLEVQVRALGGGPVLSEESMVFAVAR